MRVITDKNFLWEILANNGTLITPNNRLSEHLLLAFFHQENKKVLNKPTCFSYNLFLKNLYNRVRHLYPKVKHPILLTPLQENYLWSRLGLGPTEIENAKNTGGLDIVGPRPNLLPLDEGLINEIQKSWQTCQLWQVNIEDEIFLERDSSLHFQAWSLKFSETLENLELITECQLAKYLSQFPELFDQKQVAWISFDDFNPTQKFMQEIFAVNGCQQFIYDLTKKNIQFSQQFIAEDNEAEFNEILSWCENKIAAEAKKIAIIVPDLETKAAYLERLFAKHFAKEKFNISFGKDLIDYPIISHALEFLKIGQSRLEYQQAILLLQSPYLKNSASEFRERSEFMQTSNLMKHRHFSWDIFIKQLSTKSIKLAELLTNIKTLPPSATISEWHQLFKNHLCQLGFPGEYSLNSENYQCLQKFLTILDEFLQFNLITAELNKNEAIKSLEFLCKKTIFQPKNDEAEIQILGILEASGCNFDSVWICGLTDQCLPDKTKFSAFIPISLQKKLAMPYTSAQQELNLAKLRIQRLQNGCDDMIVSYPLFTADIPNLPSPLIKNLPIYDGNSTQNSYSTELLAEEETYQLPINDEETISGGTNLLAYQAQCPFRAFAAHRLYAKPAPIAEDGLDPLDRGQLVHQMLELIWKNLQNQNKLLNLESENLQKLIAETSITVLNCFLKEREILSPLFFETELLRLQGITRACLEWDKQRKPFNIAALEKEYIFELEGIKIKLRIDRLDRVNEEKWIIDYKNSLPTIKPWNQDRPEAPQLLLYALLDQEIKALLYLELKNGRIQCSGLSSNITNMAGIKSLKPEESWEEQQKQWLQQLQALALEYKQGYCQPQPARQNICQQCEFISLCRIEM